MINHYHFAGDGCNENVRTMGFPVLIVNIEAAVPSVPQKQKETTDLTNKERNRASVYCQTIGRAARNAEPSHVLQCQEVLYHMG